MLSPKTAVNSGLALTEGGSARDPATQGSAQSVLENDKVGVNTSGTAKKSKFSESVLNNKKKSTTSGGNQVRLAGVYRVPSSKNTSYQPKSMSSTPLHSRKTGGKKFLTQSLTKAKSPMTASLAQQEDLAASAQKASLKPHEQPSATSFGAQ